MTTTYHGTTEAGEMDWSVTFTRNGMTLDLPWRLDLRNHSPTGLSWGYGGSGPAQCALALLAHALGDDERALRLYQRFKFRVIAGLDKDSDWTLTAEEIVKICEAIEAGMAEAG